MALLDAMPGFQFGCDPELFVVNDKDELVCPDFLPGTKQKPYPVEHGAVQRDGMAAEFNIDPAKTYQEFDRNITAVMKQLEGFLPAGYKLLTTPSAVFTKEVFDAAPDDAKSLGCSPDFNAWTGEVNPPPKDPSNPYLRTASGHLHVGWTEDADMSSLQHIMNCRDLVKQLDWYLGGWSLKLDRDSQRRRLYGKAGSCRFKPYGVEYRVLSNFWLMNDNRRRTVWNRMNQAIWDMRNYYVPERMEKFHFNQILITSIDTSHRNPSLEEQIRYPLATIDTEWK